MVGYFLAEAGVSSNFWHRQERSWTLTDILTIPLRGTRKLFFFFWRLLTIFSLDGQLISIRFIFFFKRKPSSLTKQVSKVEMELAGFELLGKCHCHCKENVAKVIGCEFCWLLNDLHGTLAKDFKVVRFYFGVVCGWRTLSTGLLLFLSGRKPFQQLCSQKLHQCQGIFFLPE